MPAPNARSRPVGTAQRAPAVPATHELTNYRLAERIAQEELATVYRATHQTLDRPVQIAILRRTDWISTSRFQLAARLAARLSHPHLLPIVDAGHDERYGDYIVTPEMDARTLETMLADGSVEPLAALRICSQVGTALDYLHDQGILHRDVRPANIVVTAQGNAFLTNLSLAAAPDTPDLSSIEEADYLTPYSAPEQTLASTDAAAAQDVYSLGAVLYHMLSGELPPPPGQPPLTLAERDPALAGVDRVLRRMLAETPAQRFTSAAAAVAALRQALRKQLDNATEDMEESRWEPTAEWLENPLESVIGERLSHDFVSRSRTRADTLHRAGAIRRVLDRWSRRGMLRRPGLGQLVEPDQIVSYNVYFYELRAHYETRTTPQLRQQLYTGGQLMPGIALDVWDAPVTALEPFVDAAPEQIAVPGSQQSTPCSECNGKGSVQCPTCKGKCVIEQTRKVRDADGTTRAETLQENCPTCRGYGHQNCPKCEGSGQMLQEQVFTWSRQGKLFSTEDDLGGLHKLTLETQSDQVFDERINPHEPVWHQIAPLHELLEDALKEGGSNSRLVVAQLAIRGTSVTEVDYRHANKHHSLALIGNNDEVRGDSSLLDIERLILYIAIGVLVVLLVVFIFFLR